MDCLASPSFQLGSTSAAAAVADHRARTSTRSFRTALQSIDTHPLGDDAPPKPADCPLREGSTQAARAGAAWAFRLTGEAVAEVTVDHARNSGGHPRDATGPGTRGRVAVPRRGGLPNRLHSGGLAPHEGLVGHSLRTPADGRATSVVE